MPSTTCNTASRTTTSPWQTSEPLRPLPRSISHAIFWFHYDTNSKTPTTGGGTARGLSSPSHFLCRLLIGTQMYSLKLLGFASSRNTTNGSWWIVHVQPTKDHQFPNELNPANGSWGIVQIQPIPCSDRTPNLKYPPTAVGGIIKNKESAFCRLDLNHPPTTVGGISTFETSQNV